MANIDPKIITGASAAAIVGACWGCAPPRLALHNIATHVLGPVGPAPAATTTGAAGGSTEASTSKPGYPRDLIGYAGP